MEFPGVFQVGEVEAHQGVGCRVCPYTLRPTPYTLHPTPRALGSLGEDLTPMLFEHFARFAPAARAFRSAPLPHPAPLHPAYQIYTLHPTP